MPSSHIVQARQLLAAGRLVSQGLAMGVPQGGKSPRVKVAVGG